MSGGSLGYFYSDLESHVGDFGDQADDFFDRTVGRFADIVKILIRQDLADAGTDKYKDIADGGRRECAKSEL